MEQKKYIVSKSQRRVAAAAVIFIAVLGIPICILIITEGIPEMLPIRHWTDALACFSAAAIILCELYILIMYIWKFLAEPLMGKYSFDSYGITFYTPAKTYSFPYMECAEMGITYFGAPYIYCSKVALTGQERKNLLKEPQKRGRKRRGAPKYIRDYAFFELSQENFDDLVRCVPEKFRAALSDDE